MRCCVQFNLHPAALALIEGFIGVDDRSKRFLLGANRAGIKDSGGHELDLLPNCSPSMRPVIFGSQ